MKGTTPLKNIDNTKNDSPVPDFIKIQKFIFQNEIVNIIIIVVIIRFAVLKCTLKHVFLNIK